MQRLCLRLREIPHPSAAIATRSQLIGEVLGFSSPPPPTQKLCLAFSKEYLQCALSYWHKKSQPGGKLLKGVACLEENLAEFCKLPCGQPVSTCLGLKTFFPYFWRELLLYCQKNYPNLRLLPLDAVRKSPDSNPSAHQTKTGELRLKREGKRQRQERGVRKKNKISVQTMLLMSLYFEKSITVDKPDRSGGAKKVSSVPPPLERSHLTRSPSFPLNVAAKTIAGNSSRTATTLWPVPLSKKKEFLLMWFCFVSALSSASEESSFLLHTQGLVAIVLDCFV